MSYANQYDGLKMGCQTQNRGILRSMESGERGRPRLTVKGERTRARIVAAAARLIYEHGVASTTLDDVRAAADVSGSQMYHYFPDKDELVQAVISYQADVIAGNQRQADLGSAEGLQAWRDMVIAHARSEAGKGGCPLGSLAGQLAETDPHARALLAGGFGQWQAIIGEGLRGLHQAGQLLDDTDPDALAVTLLATLQGGLLLAQVQRDSRPLETAVDTLLQLARNGRPEIPDGNEIPLPESKAKPQAIALALRARWHWISRRVIAVRKLRLGGLSEDERRSTLQDRTQGSGVRSQNRTSASRRPWAVTGPGPLTCGFNRVSDGT